MFLFVPLIIIIDAGYILAQGLQPDTFINLSVPPVVNDTNSSSAKLGILLFKRYVFL